MLLILTTELKEYFALPRTIALFIIHLIVLLEVFICLSKAYYVRRLTCLFILGSLFAAAKAAHDGKDFSINVYSTLKMVLCMW